MTEPEKELLIEMMANIDDIVQLLTPEQKEKARRCTNKIQGNYNNLLEGVVRR